MVRTHRSIPLAFLLAAGGCAFDSGPRIAVERADSAGVEIVTSRGADVPLEWTFTEDLSLGGADEGPEAFFRLGSGGVRVDGAGNLVVLDAGNHRVSVFDGRGTHLRSMGKKGGGPGEIEFPIGFALEPGDTIAILDIAKRSFVRFGPDGSTLATRPTPDRFFGGAVEITPEGLLTSMRRSDAETGQARYELVLYRAETDSTVLATVAYPVVASEVKFPDCPVRIGGGPGMPPLFSPEVRWTARSSGELALQAGNLYRIDLYREGRIAASLRRDVAPIQVTEEIAVRQMKSQLPNGEMTIRFSSGQCTIPAADVVAARGFAPELSPIAAIALAPGGEVWVRRSAPGEEKPPIDLFDAEGAYTGTLPAGTPFPAAFLPDGRIAVVEKDELDLEHVVVYSVAR